MAYSIIDSTSYNVKLIKLRQTYWARLHTKNSWAFATLFPEHIFIRCRRGDHYSFRLSDTGILKLDPECSAHTAGALLTPLRMIDSHNPSITPLKGPLNISIIIKEALDNTEFSQFVPQVIKEVRLNITNTKNSLLGNAPSDAGITLRDIIGKALALSKYKALKGTISAYQISSITVVRVGIMIVILALVVLRCFLAGQRNREKSRDRHAALRNLRSSQGASEPKLYDSRNNIVSGLAEETTFAEPTTFLTYMNF